MTSFRKIVFPVCIVLFLFCDVGLSQNLASIRAALARGGRSVCPYCWACAHEWNCDRPCRPSYRDYCALCAYRFHCRSTCVNLCPFPETTRSTTTTITTTAPTTTRPTTTTETTTLTTPASTTPGPCTPNPCAFGGACLENTDGTFNCTCPQNLNPCDAGDGKCTNLRGKCQSEGKSCPGGYKSELCSGAANRRCCLPSPGDRKCTKAKGRCQRDSMSCPGGYRSGLCSGSANRQCCLLAGTGTGTVDYRGFTVSDKTVRDKLQQIANHMKTRVWLTSGDRRKGRKKSHHYVGSAADFWVDGGLSGGQIFKSIRSSDLLSKDFQVIWHGGKTCTGGQHIHIGRYGDGRNTCWVHEGTTSKNKCKYNCM